MAHFCIATPGSTGALADRRLHEFIGASEVLTLSQVKKIIRKVGVPDDRVPQAIDLLCDVAFLGLETKPNDFTFIYDEGKKKAAQTMARKVEESLKTRRFAINVPFHAFLQVKPGIPELSFPSKQRGPTKPRRGSRRR